MELNKGKIFLLLFILDELRKELLNIEAKACTANVDLMSAMQKFQDHTLRGKAPMGPDDWKVSFEFIM